MKMNQTQKKAHEFVTRANAAGFIVRVGDSKSVVSLDRPFAPGDKQAFFEADDRAPGLLNALGARGGSMWGTTGASVGGHSALTRGLYTLNQSGDNLRRLTEAIRQVAKIDPALKIR